LRNPRKGYHHSSHYQASCSSSSTARHHSDRDKARCGCRSDCEEMYKMPPMTPPLEYSQS
jgi:hypothetical protein